MSPCCVTALIQAAPPRSGGCAVAGDLVKGGVKLDPWGGGKLDQMSVWEMGIGREGATGAEACSNRATSKRETFWRGIQLSTAQRNTT
jgi:hypothetical protein